MKWLYYILLCFSVHVFLQIFKPWNRKIHVHFQVIYYVEKCRIRIIVMFFTKARRKRRPHFTQVWQKPLVMVLLTLTLSIYSAPLNGILCSACAYSTQKYQMCWCEQKKPQNPCSQSCKSMRKRSFSVHLLAILPQQFWSKPTFFSQRIRKWLRETNTCFDFFFPV